MRTPSRLPANGRAQRRIADPVAAMVFERAEGNPLFIEQLTFAMRDTGRIVVEDGLVRTAGAERLDEALIPDTVQRVITTRLDQLPPGESLTLKVASVIGQRFSSQTLADIYPLPIDAGTLAEHLETLTRLDLVAPASASSPHRLHVPARDHPGGRLQGDAPGSVQAAPPRDLPN